MISARLSQRPGDRLSGLEGALSAEARYLDLCLVFQRKTTGEVLLKVGGRWDRLTNQYIDAPPKRCAVVRVKENQVEIVKHLRRWLEKYLAGEKRERILLTGGNRRGGKSYVSVACILAIAIMVPEAICWLVSPNLTKRDELERYVKEQALDPWYGYRGMPEYKFRLVNGSTVQSITGDTADALKRGEATAILFNEPQDTAVDVATYGLPALIDEGGLAIFAGNPARRKKGFWFNQLREAVIEGRVRSGAFFDVPADLNDSIDQDARGDVGEILNELDPRAKRADDEGLWLPIGDRAYDRFDKKRHLVLVPEVGWDDITGDVTRRKLRRPYRCFGGVDFQYHPWNVTVLLRAFEEPQTKRVIYWAVGEVLKQGVEDELLDDIFTYDESLRAEAVFVGDNSGSWQNSRHRKDAPPSFELFRARGYRIEYTQVKKSDRGEFPANPGVEDRINLVNSLLAAGRLFVDPEKCPHLAMALPECEWKNGKPAGKWAHATDALGYALWWAEPRPTAPRAGLRLTGASSVPDARPGANIWER